MSAFKKNRALFESGHDPVSNEGRKTGKEDVPILFQLIEASTKVHDYNTT